MLKIRMAKIWGSSFSIATASQGPFKQTTALYHACFSICKIDSVVLSHLNLIVNACDSFESRDLILFIVFSALSNFWRAV